MPERGRALDLARYRLDRAKECLDTARSNYESGELPERLSPMISEAFDIRSASDYDDFYIASREDILRQISNAAEFMSITENYLSTKADDPCQ